MALSRGEVRFRASNKKKLTLTGKENKVIWPYSTRLRNTCRKLAGKLVCTGFV